MLSFMSFSLPLPLLKGDGIRIWSKGHPSPHQHKGGSNKVAQWTILTLSWWLCHPLFSSISSCLFILGHKADSSPLFCFWVFKLKWAFSEVRGFGRDTNTFQNSFSVGGGFLDEDHKAKPSYYGFWSEMRWVHFVDRLFYQFNK